MRLIYSLERKFEKRVIFVPMIKKTITLFAIFCLCFGVKAEMKNDTIYNPKVDYNAPRIYTIADIDVRGIEYLDASVIKQLSRLKVGDEIQIPGDDISLVIKRLYKQNMFGDVQVVADKIIGNDIYLAIVLKERSKLTKINFSGIKKSEIEKLKERTSLSKGGYLTANLLNKIEQIVKKYYKEKGFYNVSMDITKTRDTLSNSGMYLNVDIKKKNKVRIANVFIKGNKKVPTGVLKGAMKKTRERSLVNIFHSAKYLPKKFKEDKVKLIEKYNELGFRDAHINSSEVKEISDKRVDIYIDLTEGERYYFNKIQWVGNTVYPSEYLTHHLKLKNGDVYNKKLLDKRMFSDEDAVSNLYYDNGYLFSRMIPREIVRGKDSIDLEISVIEQSQARVNKVGIKGNDRTHEHVIRRELFSYPGDLFSISNVKRSMRELANLGLFNPETLKPDIQPDGENGTADITYLVEEKSSDQIELSGGVGGGTVLASVGLKFSNFSIRNVFNKKAWRPLPTGDGQTLTLRVQTNGKYYSQYSFSFIEPWLGGKKRNQLNVSGYMSNQTRLSSAYQVSEVDPNKDQKFRVWGASLGLTRRLKWPDNNFYLSNSINFQRYELDNWGGFYQFIDGSSNLLSFSTEFFRVSTDNPIYTRQGSKFSIGLQFTPPYSTFEDKDYSKIDESNPDKYNWVEFHKWTFKGKIYTPLNRNRKLVLYMGTEYGFLGYYDKNKRSPFEGYSVGGDLMSGYVAYGTNVIGVRGYHNNSLTPIGDDGRRSTGNVYGKMTMELRYPLSLAQSATIYVLGFVEAGNSWYDFKDFEPFNLYKSAGVGVRIFLPIFGMLGIDWAYGFDEVTGQPSANGAQFHFVLGQQF